MTITIEYRELLMSPHEALFRSSVEMAHQQHQLIQSLQNARIDAYRGTVVSISHGTVKLKLDDGTERSLPITDRKLVTHATAGTTTR